MGRVASASSFSRVPFWGCNAEQHSAVELPLRGLSFRKETECPDRLNLNKDALIGLHLLAYIQFCFLLSHGCPHAFVTSQCFLNASNITTNNLICLCCERASELVKHIQEQQWMKRWWNL